MPVAQAHEFLKAADAGRAEAAPIASGAGTVAGVIGQVAALPATGAATMGARALQAAGQAGTIGVVEKGIESRGDPMQMLLGGATGAALGAGASAGADKAIQLGRAVIDPLRGLAKSGPVEQQASARLLLAAKSSGIDDATAKAKLAELGPEGFIADVLGQKGQSLARTSANLSPDARSILESASSGRVSTQQDRLLAALGQPAARTVDDAQRSIYEAAKPAVRAAYDDAAQSGFAKPLERPGWFDSPIFKEAIGHAQATTQNRVALYGEKEGSQFGLLDAARQYLSNKSKNYADPQAIDYGNAAKKLNEFIDASVPEASKARGLAQAYKKQQEALQVGQDLSKVRPDPQAVAAASKSVAPEQVAQGYVIGKTNEINNRMPGKRTIDMFDGTPAQKEAIVLALGDKAGAVTRQTAAERQFLAFDQALKGNSTTARQLAEMGMMGGAGAAGGYLTGFDPMQAGSVAALLPVAKRGGTKLMEALAKKNEAAVAPQVAQKLLQRELPKLIKKLEDGSEVKITETARRRLVEALTREAGRVGSLGYAQN